MRVLTAEQMRAVDAATMAGNGGHAPVRGTELMEAAGGAALAYLQRRFAAAAQGPVAVLCGKGNNGGDGMVLARLLRQRGAEVRVILFGDAGALRGDAAEKWRALQPAGAAISVATDAAAWAHARGALSGARLWVDALLGTGLSSPPRGLVADVIAELNNTRPRPPMLAIDLPSGLPADGEWFSATLGEWPWERVLRADATVTFTAPKLGSVTGLGGYLCGDLCIAPIGSPGAIVDAVAPAPAPTGAAGGAAERRSAPGLPALSAWLTTASEAAPFLQPRPSDTHKGRFGHVHLLGGSFGKSGAPAMAAEAALRIGAGLVTAAVPRSILTAVAAYRPEIMTEPLAETPDGGVAGGVLEPGVWDALLHGKSVAAIGPGLTAHPEVAATVRQVVTRLPIPWVLDADGLNAFAGRAAELRSAASPGILTPHPGEMGRLLGISTAEVQGHRLACALQLAVATGAVVVLKGFRTLVAAPDGRVYVNTTGNPGMATGGSGDILTGIIAGLWGQFPAADRLLVATVAVYLHGLAADCAAGEIGEMSLCATDITRSLSAAIRRARQLAAEGGERIEIPAELR